MDYLQDEARMGSFFAEPVWAVVGASANTEKFGYKVYKALTKDLHVYPVNPKLTQIDGATCYPSLRQLPEIPGVVNIITPPGATLKVVEECAELQIKKVWMQPGAESEAAINYCLARGISVISDRCAKVEVRKYKG